MRERLRKSARSVKKIFQSELTPPLMTTEDRLNQDENNKRDARSARDAELQAYTEEQEFKYLTGPSLDYKDDIIGVRHPDHENTVRRGISFLLTNNTFSPAKQASVIIADENAVEIANAIDKLNQHGIQMTDMTLLALGLTGKNNVAFCNFLLNIKILKQVKKLHFDLGNVLISITNVRNLAYTFEHIDEKLAPKLTDIFVENIFSTAALAKAFTRLIDEGVMITEELLNKIQLEMRNNKHARVKNVFDFLKSISTPAAQDTLTKAHSVTVHVLTSNPSSRYRNRDKGKTRHGSVNLDALESAVEPTDKKVKRATQTL